VVWFFLLVLLIFGGLFFFLDRFRFLALLVGLYYICVCIINEDDGSPSWDL